MGDTGDGESEEDLPRAAREVGDHLALSLLQQSFQGEYHPLKIPVIDAMDLEESTERSIWPRDPNGLHSLAHWRVSGSTSGRMRMIRSPPSIPYFTIRDTIWEESKPERDMCVSIIQ